MREPFPGRRASSAQHQYDHMGVNLLQTESCWALQGRPDLSGPVEHVCVGDGLLRVGRSRDANLRINRQTVSSLHAELFQNGEALWLRDRESTNGTYVNGVPVTAETELHDADLVQFADAAFRVNRISPNVEAKNATVATAAYDDALALVQFDRLMSRKAVIPHFQPIVEMASLNVMGYEVLGRSRHYGLESPRDMFLAASQLSQEGELSELLRLVGAEKGEVIGGKAMLFLNTHPVELVTCGLLESLSRLRELHPVQDIVVEVHEAAVTDNVMMATLRERLTELDMQLAYDDFGAGETRLVQLANVSPDFVKFDMHMIRDIHLASPRQRQLLGTLVKMVREFGIASLAEGVESRDEHAVCCEIGFDYGQGYYYGKPKPPESIGHDGQNGPVKPISCV